jgi:hypothetical protein
VFLISDYYLLNPVMHKYINIQYWCVDGKNRIDVVRLRNGGKTSFSEYMGLLFVIINGWK